MLFLVSKEGVPAIAPLVLPNPDFTIPQLLQQPLVVSTQNANLETSVGVSLEILNQKVFSEQDGPPVIVGLRPICPNGRWGGPYEALNNIKDIDNK